MDLVKQDPGLIQSNPEPIVYRCKKCRRIIAAKSNLITHTAASIKEQKMTEPKPKVTSTRAEIHNAPNDENAINEIKPNSKGLLERLNTQLYISSTNSDKSSDCEAQPRCKEIIFIEPLAWMLDITKQTQGKLNCPKCQSKLGNFTWINSCNCPCGKNIFPAFYLVPSKVELTHSVQNVEITV